MTKHQEKPLVVIRKSEVTIPSTMTRILKIRSGSPSKIMPAITNENDGSDQLKKLDKQVAEIKKRQKYENLSLSPKCRHSKPINTLLNPISNQNDASKVQVLDEVNINNQTIDYGYSTISSSSSSESHSKLNNKKSINMIPIKSTISSSYSNSPPNSSSNEQVIKRVKYLSHEELLVQDTQVINSALTSSTSLSPPSSRNYVNTRPKKAGSINMFDSIPSTIIIENDNSIQVPDSSSFDNEKLDTTIKDNTGNDECDSANTTFNNHLFSSSPIKSTPRQKKQVAFSSDIESSPLTSSPIKMSSGPRSILKFTNHHLKNQSFSLESILKKDLSSNESWLPGLIIQIPDGYPEISKFVSSCVTGLSNRQFKRHYEVFATLNDLIKKNPRIINNKVIFTKEIIKNITISVRNDLNDLGSELKKGSNAFKLRTSSQGIKLIASLISASPLTDELSAIYDHLITFLKNESISKNLVTSIFQLIKIIPDQFHDKIRSIISSITQMKYFESATVTCEKLNILKRFIILKPAIANKCNYQILSHVFYSIINTDVSAYSRILFSSISVLTAYAKNDESKLVISKLLSEELEDSCSSIRSTSENPLKPSMTISQALCETLKYLIHLQLYQQATKIWAYTLYLISYGRKKFSLESWELFRHFQSVYNELGFNRGALLLCLEAWKSVVYNFQMVSVRDLSDDQLTKKLDLLVSPFENIPLINDDGTPFTQWSENERFILLYCRVFYAIRLHMENASESQMSILFKYLMKPILKLKQWDSFYLEFLKIVYTSDRNTYCESSESCFWLSDFEKWKSRISSLPKAIFKNPTIFESNLQIGRQMMGKPCDMVCYFFNTCIYKQVESLKLLMPTKEYCKIANMCIELVIELFEFNQPIIENGGIEDAKLLFKFIEKMDEYLIFYPNFEPLIKGIIDIMSKCGSIYFIKAFIELCSSKFEKKKLFIAFMISNVYQTNNLIDNDMNFPPLINYSIDLTTINEGMNQNDQEKLVDNLINAITYNFKDNLQNKYQEITTFFKETKIFEILNSELRYKLFSQLLLHCNCISGSSLFFYENTDVEWFRYSLEKFDNMEKKEENSLTNGVEFMKYLSEIQNVEQLTDSWIDEISDRLGYIIHPEISYDETIMKLFDVIKDRIPSETAARLKKIIITSKSCGMLIDSDNFDGEKSKDMNFNDTFDEGSESNDLLSTQIIVSSQEKEEDKEKVFNDTDGNKYVNNTILNDNTAIKVGDLKSFIIDSIQIEGSVDENMIRVPCKSEIEKTEEHISPAKRTRSHTKAVTDDEKEIEPPSKKQRKIKKSKKKRDRSRSLSVELENAAMEGSVEKGGQEGEKKKVNIETDMGQFRELLRNINKIPIQVAVDEKEELENELLALLMKLKKS